MKMISSKHRWIVIFILGVLLLTGCTPKVQEIVDKYITVKGESTEEDLLNNLEVIDEGSEEPESTSEFIFKEIEAGKIEYEYVADETKVVYLHMVDSIYYPILIPANLDYITDNSKYLYAKDSSVSISVVSNISMDDFTKAKFIDNAKNLTPRLIVSTNDKGPQEAALHYLGEKVIIVKTYDNAKAYETILYGMQTQTYKDMQYNVLVESETTKSLTKLPIYEGYKVSVYPNTGDDFQKIYNFDTGYLTVSTELRKFQDAYDLLEDRLAVVAGTNVIDKVFKEQDKMYYTEIGDYVIGVYNVNINTTYTCFGYGEEAKYNVIKFLESQE